jgi:NAD dependent epimerase/dehydratase family enzyme
MSLKMRFNGYKILLIGGGGAIGVELKEILIQQGATLVCTTRPGSSNNGSQNIEIVPFKELGTNCPKVDLIINAAGNYSVDWSTRLLKESVDSNIGISVTIAQYVIKHNIQFLNL